MDCLRINGITEGDIIAVRCNYTMQLYSLAFQNVQDVRSHQEEISTAISGLGKHRSYA